MASNNKKEKSPEALDSVQDKALQEPSSPTPEPSSNKYAPQERVRPTIGRDQIGGPKQRVTPRFNSVSTVLN